MVLGFIGFGFLCVAFFLNFKQTILTSTIFVIAVILLALLQVFLIYKYAQRVRKRYFDQIFLPLGLTGKTYLSTSRQYHGEYNGRGVHIYLQPIQRSIVYPLPKEAIRTVRYIGDRLEMFLEAPLKTRLSVFNKEYAPKDLYDNLTAKPAYNVIKNVLLKFANPAEIIKIAEIDDLVVLGKEAEWGKSFIENAEIREALKNILTSDKFVGIKSVQINPGAISFTITLDLNDINTNYLREALGNLENIARAASKLPPPMVIVEESENERISRIDRDKLFAKYWWIIWGVLFVFLGIPTIILLFVFRAILKS